MMPRDGLNGYKSLELPLRTPILRGYGRVGHLGQGTLASAADLGHIRLDELDSFRRQSAAMRSRMARLSARLTAAGGLDNRFGSRRWIGRRGRGGVRGVTVELAAEFVEIGLQLGDLLLGLLQSHSELAALRTGELRGRSRLAHSLITILRPERIARNLAIIRSPSA